MDDFNRTFYIAGPSGSGKTTFMKRHKTGDFLTTFVPSQNGTITNLKYYTNHGLVKIKLIETNTFNFNQLVDGFILFYEHNEEDYSSTINQIIVGIKSVHGEVPIVVCFNKLDLSVNGNHHYTTNINGAHCYLVSAKSNYNFEKPFLYLMKKTIINNIKYIEAPPIISEE